MTSCTCTNAACKEDHCVCVCVHMTAMPLLFLVHYLPLAVMPCYCNAFRSCKAWETSEWLNCSCSYNQMTLRIARRLASSRDDLAKKSRRMQHGFVTMKPRPSCVCLGVCVRLPGPSIQPRRSSSRRSQSFIHRDESKSPMSSCSQHTGTHNPPRNLVLSEISILVYFAQALQLLEMEEFS